MKVLYIAPGEEPKALDIEDKSSVIAGLCGGVPMAMPFSDDWAALLFDPEAKARNVPENFRYKGLAFHGPVLVVGLRRGRHRSLTKEQISNYSERLGGVRHDGAQL